jgi:hypothetical protein
MRVSGRCFAFITASLVLPVAVGCVSPTAASGTRSPAVTSAPDGAAPPDSTGYNAVGSLAAVAAT